MSNSETSSDIKIKYENSNGDNLLEHHTSHKPISTDTDYYFNIIANPNKIIQKKESESSEFNQIINDSESSQRKSSDKSSHKSYSSSKSNTTRKSESSHKSREKYEKIHINQPKQQSIPLFIPPIPTFNQEIKPDVKQLTTSEIRMRKIEMLRKLSEIKIKGYQLSKEYDFNSSLDEMEYEFDLLKSFADKRNGVKIFKSGLLQAVSLVEFLNDKYDPFDFHLSGWGDHMHVESESWDDVLEEIYEKYKGSGKKMAPEIRLLFLIVASAAAFHFTKSQSANLPGLDSLLASNPGLLSKIINPGKSETSQFMSPQEINIEKQKADIKKNNQNQPFFRNITPNNQTNPNIIPKPVLTKIVASDTVKNILNRIHNLQPSNIKLGNTETQDETSSNNDRIVSESTLSDSNSKKKVIKKPKKSGISIL